MEDIEKYIVGYYKKKEGDKIWWAYTPQIHGTMTFTFDKKKLYNVFGDYPRNLSKEEKQIFDSENPYWKDFFNGRDAG